MPIPLSSTVSVPACLSAERTIWNGASPAASSGCVSASVLSFSQASAALEISSRRKTSRFE